MRPAAPATEYIVRHQRTRHCVRGPLVATKESQNRISKDGFGVKADFEYDAISAG
jgi:hypothetical protein